MRMWRGLCDPELWRPHTQGLGRGSRGGWNVGSVAPKGSCGISIAENFLARVLESDSNLTSQASISISMKWDLKASLI